MTDFQTYLEAKRTVDDRALNRRVFEQFADAVDDRETPVRIVELGAGTGTMIARLAAWDGLPEQVSYRAIDRDAASIEHARAHVPDWLAAAGYEIETSPGSKTVVARSGEQRLEVALGVADAFDIDDSADVVIASAFLDVVPLVDAIETIAELLGPGGVLYAPITFDGGTRFAPRDSLDDRIERYYHRHMDDVRPTGGSQTGSELLVTLPDRGWDVQSTGGSDWIVRPNGDGYPGLEREFVAHLLETIEGALADFEPDVIAPTTRERWFDRRRRELDRGELVFVAHNLDVLARRPPPQS